MGISPPGCAERDVWTQRPFVSSPGDLKPLVAFLHAAYRWLTGLIAERVTWLTFWVTEIVGTRVSDDWGSIRAERGDENGGK